MKNRALPNCSLSPQLGIRGMALWMGGREEVSLVSFVTHESDVKLFVNDDLCVSSCKTGSIHKSGRVVNGMIARAAS